MEIIRTKAELLKDSITYGEKSIVSRQLIKSPAGNITLFAFDEGEGLSEHSAPYDAFVQVLEGEAEITIGGISYRVKEGEFIIMPANIPHAVKANGRFKMMLVMIRG
ncbi:MAG: cupin domain-containing protein [Bacteroidales bacterium]